MHETHDAMMTLYGQRFDQHLDVATVDQILHNWNLSRPEHARQHADVGLAAGDHQGLGPTRPQRALRPRLTLYGQRFDQHLDVATVDQILHNWNLSELMER
jgi:hypothetical protein